MRKVINWKIFFILLAACLFGVIAVFPYVLTVQKDALQKVTVSIPFLISIQVIQSTILFSISIFVGLLLAKKVGFSLPVLEAIVYKGDIRKVLRSIAYISISWGALAGIAIILLDRVFILLGASLGLTSVEVPLWQRLLVPFYGGINEEVLLRLFIMTVFVWISFKIKKTKQKTPTTAGIWISIIFATVLFGLGHLPITSSLTALTPLVVARAIVLNGLGGVIFGWLYWKKGLESAMIAHFTADVVIHILFPVLLGLI